MLICCSSNCERCHKCGKYLMNLSTKYKNTTNKTVENLYSFGSGAVSASGSEIYYYCGSNGNYAMYEPIEIEPQESKDYYSVDKICLICGAPTQNTICNDCKDAIEWAKAQRDAYGHRIRPCEE